MSSSEEEEIVIKRQVVKIKPRTIKSQPQRTELTLADNIQSQQVLDNTDLPDSPSKPKKTKTYDDEDGFFTRSTSFTRNVSTKKIKPVKILKELEENNFDDDLSTYNEKGSRLKRSRHKEKASKSDWTLSDDPIDIDINDYTNDLSDSLDEPMEISKTNDKKEISDPIDREPSLTPPPELNEYQLRTTVGTLRATLSQYSEGLRSESADIGSPGVSYEPQDDIELDPELLAIQQSIKHPYGKSNRYVDTKVEIIVLPVRHPDIQTTDVNKTVQAEFEKPIKFIMKAQDNFERMIKNICEKRGIGKQDIVLTYKKVKVFPRSTPESLGMSGQAHMEVFTKDTYNYYKERNVLLKHRMLEEIERESKLFSEDLNESDFGKTEKTDNDYLHLKLLSKDESINKLKIKKALTVQAVIDHYKKIRDIPYNVEMKLMFEDEALSVTDKLEDTDLEDGDMLTVVINC